MAGCDTSGWQSLMRATTSVQMHTSVGRTSFTSFSLLKFSGNRMMLKRGPRSVSCCARKWFNGATTTPRARNTRVTSLTHLLESPPPAFFTSFNAETSMVALVLLKLKGSG
eukprot:Pompholyxophrys_punicea_v1_NODE_178_length_2994_cov_7.487581.p3 type:complete len:111 gc:universal NODE_178_length_2994_cov_7.487581:1603-1935(+)